MINTKGEYIFTNTEIAYELGLSPATINAIAKRLYGNRIAHWTAVEARRIIEYIKSISAEEDAKRLSILHDIIVEVGYEKQNDEEVRRNAKKDLRNVP